ncbi:hypothetical protein AXG93_4831s1160 [Marchantia polymorpha subsp. ruderalis]|uniref:RING-type E3 ubiquitin transferase n=1 Tax=Marchantia polymorpha subsp. ruderalis TaxID=1480154 RepID=A0A176WB76_MARPO|nr:hypothetical protein AXG93_4831s1160 [Marchantia polymorpha subsp. ruderalis]
MARLIAILLNALLFSLSIIHGSSIWAEAVDGYASSEMAWAGNSGGRVGDVSLGAPKKMKYTRQAELKARCPALTLRSEEAPTRTRRRRPLMQRLSFRDGNWEQGDRVSALMPFKPSNQFADLEYVPRTQLASFWVTNVDRNQLLVCNVAGMVELSITDGSMSMSASPVIIPTHETPLSRYDLDQPRATAATSFQGTSSESQFIMYPGFSTLSIELEGVYQQAQNEDVLCMLGCAFLPSPDSGISWSNMQNFAGTKQLVKDCSIMLQLHYPLTFNLTSRVIRGELKSLKSLEEPFYFLPVFLSSQITADSVYESTAKDIVASACNSEDQTAKYVDTYKPIGMEFCELAKEYLSEGWMDIDTNWNCSVSQEFCGKIGPFVPYSTAGHYVKAQDYNASKAQIMVQNFRSPCFTEEETVISVSSVFRLIPVDETRSVAFGRSALDGQTIVTEGYWGTINSTLAEKAFHPLSFHVKLDFNRGFPWRLSSHLHYNYTRVDDAGVLLEKDEVVSKSFHSSWLNYPKLIGESLAHYRVLSEDLSLHTMSLDSKDLSYIDFDVVAIDDYLPFLWSGWVQTGIVEAGLVGMSNDTIQTETDPRVTNRVKENRQYLNIAGTLSIRQPFERTEMKISTEGLYSPKHGKMYMLGCRSVTAQWETIREYYWSLDEGMDCEIEVMITYPATIAAWLSDPTVEVVVKSKRVEDSPFHFQDIKVQTERILYKKQRQQLVSQKSVEGALSVLTLSLMLGCIISGLLYLGHQVDSTPYVSLVMIGIQGMGYAIPLVTGAEALLTRKFDYRRHSFFVETGWAQMIVYLDKILTLVAFLFMVRLFEVVWKSRAFMPSARSPREHNVAVTCAIIHALGFISVMTLHSQNIGPRAGDLLIAPPSIPEESQVGYIPGVVNVSSAEFQSSSFFDVDKLRPVWKVVLQEYAGLVEDLFLLPQAIALSVWDVEGKPLRAIYFVGLTILQIVPHIYDSFRIPGLRGVSYEIYANPDFDFYTSLGNILIPILALLLAVMVYIQQRWKNFLRFPSRFSYKPLNSKMNETELVQNHGRTPLPPIPEDDE